MDKKWSSLLCFAVVHCHYCIGLLGFTCCPISISIIVLDYVQKNPPNGWDGWGGGGGGVEDDMIFGKHTLGFCHFYPYP